jgi:1-acyl-sn-glycerol-3-phosphate acyltransferase
MIRIIFSIYVWLLVTVVTLTLTPIFLIIWLLTVAIDKRLIILHHFSNIWGSSFTKLVPGWKVTIIGKEKLDQKAKVIVANHQSQEDILLIYRLGVPFNWISKAEVFKIPFYGWFMYLNGDIKLRRTSKSSIKRMILDAEKVLRQGSTITIFPEGTRSKTDKIGHFKEGAFKIAQDTKVPIVPVAIYGTGNKLIYPNGIFKGKHQVIVKVLDKIPYEQFKDKEIKDLASEVRSLIESEIKLLKQSMSNE